MKKVFVLFGPSNCGKTLALRRVYGLLRARPNCKELPIQWDEVTRGSDIVVILEINGVKVGITTLGDPVPEMKPNLIYLVKQGCYVIVCATRTRGKTTAAVDRLRQDHYDIVWIEKRRIDAPSNPPTEQQEADSNEKARSIVEQVEAAISEATKAAE